MFKRIPPSLTLLIMLLLPCVAYSFSAPQIRAVSIIEKLPRATHHGLFVTIDPIIDPSLKAFRAEVSKDNGATWIVFSKNIRPYDSRYIVLPYRTKEYGLSTNVDYALRLCAIYGAETDCSSAQNFRLPIIVAQNTQDNGDVDDDILATLQEYNIGTDPRNPDSDEDQMADPFEVARGIDPSFSQKPLISVDPPSIDFGFGTPNGLAPNQHRIITVTNKGNRVLRISNGLFSGNNQDQFKYFNKHLEVVNLAPKQSRRIAIDFLPTSLGAMTASLDILSDDKEHFPVSVSLQGIGKNIAHLKVEGGSRLIFPTTAVGENSEQKIIKISNPESDRPLLVSIFLKNTLNFIALPNHLWLEPGKTQDVAITFTPEWAGSYEGLLEIRGANTVGGNKKEIALSAEATGPPPRPRLQSGGIVFGSVNVGSEDKKQFVIYNDGEGALYIKKMDFGKDGTGDQNGFRVSSDNLFVPPGGSNRIEVTFKPTAKRQYTSQLCFVTNGEQPASISSVCKTLRPIGDGINFPQPTHIVNLSGVGL